MKKIISIPDGFSLDLTEYNLVINVSPFPTLKPLALMTEPYETEEGLVWVKLDSRTYGLFELKMLNPYRCPTCGQAWSHHEENN